MPSRRAARLLLFAGVVMTAALSLGCEGGGGVGIASGYPYGAGPSTPLGVGTVWAGSPGGW